MLRLVIAKLSVLALLASAGTSVALALADREVRPLVALHHQRYRAVAEYLRGHTRAEEKIFVWGNSPSIYLYAQRRMATRYLSVNYQTGRVWGTPANEIGGRPDSKNVPVSTWDNLMSDLERNRPVFIVDAASGKLDKMEDEPLERHPKMWDFVRRHYVLDAVVAGVPLYRRK
ncbi:MAG: hypothetical protein QM784_22230 [Polyangiaceae bacterium]